MFTRVLNRVTPALPVTAMKTFAIFAPVKTHFRPATCEEIGCLAFHNGWTYDTTGMPADVTATVKRSGRRFTVTRREDSGGELLHFEPGQPCFKATAHRMRVDRPEIFLSRSGDWRGNPDGRAADPVVYSGADAWTDALHTTLGDRTHG